MYFALEFTFTFLEILMPLSPGPRSGREENVGIVGGVLLMDCRKARPRINNIRHSNFGRVRALGFYLSGVNGGTCKYT